MTVKTTRTKEDGRAKMQYESPRLEVYGDIRVITEAVAHNSRKTDGGPHALRTA